MSTPTVRLRLSDGVRLVLSEISAARERMSEPQRVRYAELLRALVRSGDLFRRERSRPGEIVLGPSPRFAEFARAALAGES